MKLTPSAQAHVVSKFSSLFVMLSKLITGEALAGNPREGDQIWAGAELR